MMSSLPVLLFMAAGYYFDKQSYGFAAFLFGMALYMLVLYGVAFIKSALKQHIPAPNREDASSSSF